MNREQVYDALDTIIKGLETSITDLGILTRGELGGVHFNEAIEAKSLIRKAERMLSEVKETI